MSRRSGGITAESSAPDVAKKKLEGVGTRAVRVQRYLVLFGGSYNKTPPDRNIIAVAARGPRAEVVEIPGCGHAPGLMDSLQIALIRDWLLAEG